jgi:hypothetical protein
MYCLLITQSLSAVTDPPFELNGDTDLLQLFLKLLQLLLLHFKLCSKGKTSLGLIPGVAEQTPPFPLTFFSFG